MRWTTKPIGELFKLKQGRYLPPEDMERFPTGLASVPVYGANGIIGYTSRVMYDVPVPLISCRGANCGVNHFTLAPCWISNNSIACVDSENDPRFFYYSFLNDSFRDVIGGSAQPQITISSLSPKHFAVPPLPTQRRIAGILSAYDDLIENNTRRIAILEDMARRLFEEWFVHFRFPGGTGEMPWDWATVQLRKLLELKYGKALKADTRVAGQIPVYGSSGVVGNHDTALVAGPGIILGRKGNVGSVHRCRHSFYVIDTAFYVVSHLPTRFIYQLLKQQTFLNSDAAVPGLNREQALSIEVTLPAIPAISAFDDIVEPIDEQIELLAQSNNTLRAARDLLLPKLISGEIDLDRAAAAAPPELLAAE